MADPVHPIPGPSNPNPEKPVPEAVLAHLRTLRSQIGDVEPLSQAQRKRVRRRLRVLPQPVVEASINVIGVLDNVSQAIGQPLDEVRRLQDETLRWDAVVDEARAFLKSVQGANLMRRQQLALIAAQAYTIGTQLAKDPAKSVLVPHVEEVKRLKGVARRRKATQAPRPPAPLPTPVPDLSTTGKA